MKRKNDLKLFVVRKYVWAKDAKQAIVKEKKQKVIENENSNIYLNSFRRGGF